MYRILSFVLYFSLLGACSQKEEVINANQRIPLTGQSNLPQIFLVLDETQISDPAFWGDLNSDSISSDLPVRIESVRVKTIEEAKEQLQVLNGRKIDFLFLGRGSPQKAWEELKLPKHEGRRIFALEAKSSDLWTSLRVNRPQAIHFINELCHSSFVRVPCQTHPSTAYRSQHNSQVAKAPLYIALSSRALDSTLEGNPLFLSVWVDWSEFLKFEVLAKNEFRDSMAQNREIVLGFETNYLKMSEGPSLKNAAPDFKKEYESFYSKWSLNFLSKDSNSQKSSIPADLLKHPNQK